MVIGVTDEAVSTVDSWFAKAQPRYPIVILEDKSFEKALGVKFFPTGAVMSPEGRITYSGSAGGTGPHLKEALKEAEKSPLFPKELAKVRKAMAAGDLGLAWEQSVALHDKAAGDPELLAWVERFGMTLDQHARDKLEAARAEEMRGLDYKAVALLEEIVEVDTPFACTEEASTWLNALVSREGYRDEMKGGALYEKAEAVEREREYTDAAKAFLKIDKKYPQSRIGAAARRRAEALVNGGLCGYTSACRTCKSTKRACDKHADKVKLD